ncbi:MAG: AI-2E family transporter, partial [Gammaproteobacteria bacterium]|nr:AI-2E family transporter [Gammaproteobacteria bacterium]
KLYSTWQLASENLSAALKRLQPLLTTLGASLIATAGGAGAAFFQMFFSIIVAGVFLATKESSMAGIEAVMSWLVGERSGALISVSESTVRSVAGGVLGAAIIETVLSVIGLVVADVPAAGFWALMILVLSIVQVPPLLLLIPLVVYAVSASEPFGATVFAITSILAVMVDTFLKPLLLGRGANVPTLIVLMGAIGGMILSGIVGLFVGAVVLVLGWELLQFWLKDVDAPASESPGPT